MISKADLIKRTLEKMAIYGPNETASAADQTTVADAYDAIYAELQTDGYARWRNETTNEPEIPEKYVRALVNILAGDVGPYFGKPDYSALMAPSYNRLIQLQSNQYTPHVTETQFT